MCSRTLCSPFSPSHNLRLQYPHSESLKRYFSQRQQLLLKTIFYKKLNLSKHDLNHIVFMQSEVDQRSTALKLVLVYYLGPLELLKELAKLCHMDYKSQNYSYVAAK
jgi:hypothetical protein